MKIKCECQGHLLEISLDVKPKSIQPNLSIIVYDLFGKYKPYKKPKLLGDVVIADWNKKNLTRFFKSIRKFEQKYNALKSNRSNNTTKNRRK